MSTCYIVAAIDKLTRRVITYSLSSEDADDVACRVDWCLVDVDETHAETYHEAHQAAEELVESGRCSWLKGLPTGLDWQRAVEPLGDAAFRSALGELERQVEEREATRAEVRRRLGLPDPGAAPHDASDLASLRSMLTCCRVAFSEVDLGLGDGSRQVTIDGSFSGSIWGHRVETGTSLTFSAAGDLLFVDDER